MRALTFTAYRVFQSRAYHPLATAQGSVPFGHRPLRGLLYLFSTLFWGLRPRLYATVRSADSLREPRFHLRPLFIDDAKDNRISYAPARQDQVLAQNAFLL